MRLRKRTAGKLPSEAAAEERRSRGSKARPGTSVFTYYGNAEQGGARRSGHEIARPVQDARRGNALERTSGIAQRAKNLRDAKRVYAAKTGPLVLIGAFCGLLLLWNATLTSSVKFSVADKGGTPRYRSLRAYEQAAQSMLAESMAYRTKFSIDTNAFNHRFQEKFPELSSVVMILPLVGRQPTVYIASHQPVMMLSSAARVYVLDETGHVLLLSSEMSDSELNGLPLIQDESGVMVAKGEQAVTTDMVRFVQMVMGQLKAKGLEVDRLTLPKLANELHVKLRGQGYFIKFDTNGDARQQVGTYLAVKDKLQADRVTPAEYIDVRVEEKAYYR